jgi:heme-degrading monooxygenase HmoA
MAIRRVPWKPGPADGADGEVFVSLTDYTDRRWRNVPRVWFDGLRLRRAWPSMRGAVGLVLWAEAEQRRCGSVSVWTSEDDLRAFVRWPPHVAIMSRHRDRGDLVATSWRAERFDREAIWAEARRRLREAPGAAPAAAPSTR